MAKKEKKQKNVTKVKRRLTYRGKQMRTSIYFLLWAIFTALSVFIILVCGISQNVVLSHTYKRQASREVTETGREIHAQLVRGLPDEFGGNLSGYLRFLARTYNVEVLILNEDGDVLFPLEHNFDPDAPEIFEQFDYSDEIEVLKQKLLDSEEEGEAVYETENEYVYGVKMSLYSGATDVYLYTSKSLELVNTAAAKLVTRTVLISVFVLVLAFAVSSAVSGWLTKPITEMTDKARQLARGDFSVDFHGADYGLEMVELADTLNFARDELSKTDKMQKDLIANVSHDFKTPLTMIKAYASMIIEISGEMPEKRNKHAQVIVDEADRLASLVNDVLDLSKISSGIETLKDDVFDMSAYCYEILDRFAYLKETQGYQFVTDVDKDLYTRADRLKIGQVLYNLIGNAVNYTGENKKVYVSLKKEGDGAFRFAVTDTGKGIKPEELDAVWDRYYRSSEMHKRPVKGTGLGLSIVKTVLERHNFAFGIDSKVGIGSTFFVLFPYITVEETDEE